MACEGWHVSLVTEKMTFDCDSDYNMLIVCIEFVEV